MKILHTADWHLGNSIHSVDRTEEQKSFLDWLVQTINTEEIDALIVAGDVFDTYSPSNVAQQMYYSFLASLVNSSCKNVIIIGGNHDSGKLLEAPKDILNAINVKVVGRVENKEIEDMVFRLKGNKEGEEVICAAVPYMNELELRKYLTDEEKDNADTDERKFMDKTFTKVYGSFLEKAEEMAGGKDIPIIATGHLYAAGLEGRYEGVEKEEKTDDGVAVLDVVGNLGKVHIGCFPERFDYVALGHIHYMTRVAKQKRVMYSGSPFVMGYDDASVKHHVLVLDIGKEEEKRYVNPTPITVPEWIRFERIPGTKEEIVDRVKSLAAASKDNSSSGQESEKKLYLELYYNPEDGAYLHEQIESIELPEHIKIVSWNIKKSDNIHTASFGDYDIQSVQNISPEDVVRQLVLSKLTIPKEQAEKMTEEEISKYEEEEVNKYLPHFMKAFDEVAKEGNGEDN